MKKIILSMLVSLMVLSCNKKTNSSVSNLEPATSKTEISNSGHNASRTKPQYMLFFKSRDFFVCMLHGGNCLPMVVVRPHSADLVTNLLAVVEGGDQTAIQQYFNLNKEALVEYIESGDIDGVINGGLTAAIETNPELQLKYLVLTNPARNEIEIVYPFQY